MSQVDLGKFKCDACGRQYPWKPDYAGRKVKCKCGAVMTAPTEPPQPEPPPQDDDLLGGLYELAAEEKAAAKAGATIPATGLRCPSCQADMNVGDTVCPACGFNLKTGLKARAEKATAATGASAAMLAYASASRHAPADAKVALANSVGGAPLKELYIPAALVVAGLIAQGYIYYWDLPSIGVALVANLVLSFVGVAIVARLLELGFGAPGPAVLKMAAICLLPAAIAHYIGTLVGAESPFVRAMVGAMLIMPLTEAGFMLLFDLAYDEALYCTVVIWLVNQWAVMFLVGAIITGAGVGFGGGGTPSASKQIAKADEAAAMALSMGNAQEAEGWLKESNNRIFSGETNESSLKVVQDAYAAGANKVTAITSSGESDELILTVPSKSADRKKFFEWLNKYEAASGTPAEDRTKDEGQKYHVIDFY